jgi:predicted ATPase
VSRNTLVEQPEIHVHPAVQVGLGDLFIDAATGEETRRLLLVETHQPAVRVRDDPLT